MKKLFNKYVILLLLIAQFTLIYESSSAQWVYTNGIYGGNVNSLTVSGTNLFASTVSGGVFKSTDNGANWVQSGLAGNNVFSLGAIGSNILAGLNAGGTFLSTNNGANWDAISSTPLLGRSITGFTTNGADIYASANNNGVYRSTDNGVNWDYCDMINLQHTLYTIASGGNSIYAGGWFVGVFRSTNNGNSWVNINNGLTILNVISLAVNGPNIFAGTVTTSGGGGGVFRSTNYGANWMAVNNGLTDLYIKSIVLSGTNIFVGTQGGVFCSTNNGDSWVDINQGFITIPQIPSLLIANNYIYAGTNNQSVWRRPLSELIVGINSKGHTLSLLQQNYPNPFNHFTVIRYQLRANSDVILKIYDYNGKEVATLINTKQSKGIYEIKYDAAKLKAGIYYYTLSANDIRETKQMILIK